MAGKANPRGKTRPVEWEAYHDVECGQWQVNDSDQREIIATGIETEENANVLAAAPKMLKALKQLAELQRKWRSDDEAETIDSIEYMDEIDKILWTDIIAEAEGRRP